MTKNLSASCALSFRLIFMFSHFFFLFKIRVEIIYSYEEKEIFFFLLYLHLDHAKGESFVKENKFQAKLIKEIKDLFPGCIVLKNDAEYIQGFPDLTILYGKHWAVLETKGSEDASHQPNQDYYILKTNEMSFGKFISPENKTEVLNELQSAFRS